MWIWDNNIPFFFILFFFFFLTVFLSFFFLSYLGLYGVFFINLLSLGLFWFSLLFYINDFFKNQIIYNIYLTKWIFINYNVKININFLIDSTSFSFFFLTTTIGLFVYIYTFCYFRFEPLVERFLLFLCSFILSMLFLVSSGNIIMLFLGWELIGLTSFFLINFWSTKVSTLKAAFKAFTFNKISDFFLFVFLIIVYNLTYDFDIMSINNQIIFFKNFKINLLNFNVNVIEVLCFFLLSCSFIKSAQFGAHIWLPDSMEAPVPASSLIHSATLVSAGVFIILRFYPLFENSFYSFFILPFIGSLTAAYGGLVGFFQSDIKRILAYSTISHCGFLILLTSFNFNEFVIIYLYVHGFFKASVFMCVGNVIRISKNYQDYRKMGLFYKYLPFECFVTFICLVNLSGIPFSLGFFIKHLIFLGLQTNIYLYYMIIFFIAIGAISGLFYSYKVFFFVFFDFKKSKKNIYINLNKKNQMSYYYTNTSLLSNISIVFLIIISYTVSYYLLNITFNKYYSINDFSNFSFNSNFYNLFNENNYFLFNLSFLNWFVIFVLLNFVILNWRFKFYSYINYNYINFYSCISLISYVFYFFM